MTDLFSCILKGDFTGYKAMIDRSSLRSKNAYGANPLHIAIAYGKTDIALDLLARGIDINDTNDEGMTSFTTSIIGKNWGLANEILKKNPSVNIRDNYGNNSLWYAVLYSNGNYELVKAILELGGDAITKNRAGRSPQDLAKKIDDIELEGLLSKTH